MIYFLERIASLLHDEYGNRLDKHCIVFPNRRAGLYFLKYLAGKTGNPVWAPAVKTINELFQSCSTLQIAESELLIHELYKVYRKLNSNAESFDEFFYWGDMLLNDFDDVDKYMVNASVLFTNLSDIRRIDNEFGGLTPEQVKVIKQFWVNLKPESLTQQKSDFLNIWSLLPSLYSEFQHSLRTKGLAYEGMIYRDLADRCRTGNPPVLKWDCIHFIGFNALNNCEKLLMGTLKQNGLAKFYWDYDNSYISSDKNHTAGYFIRQNLRQFGNDMHSDWEYDTFLSAKNKQSGRKVIDTPSDVGQVKLVSKLLEELSDVNGQEAHHTAIVLADENMLIPALTSLPENIDSVNITMGYPLKFSPVYTLVRHLLMLQKNSRTIGNEIEFDYRDVMSILKHNFFAGSDDHPVQKITSDLARDKSVLIPSSRFNNMEPFNKIFIKAETPASLSVYLKDVLTAFYIQTNDSETGIPYTRTEINIRNEFIYRTLLAINRLDSIVLNTEVNLNMGTYIKLLDRILRDLSIPFSGEPLEGIQIMGILETRALDFKNLIILSVNEEILPRKSPASSYIPYSLREAFGLPTIRHQDSIYAYYFYRLLQRAENITFIYNSNSEGLKTGEMSRFLLQLKFLSESPPEFTSLMFEIKTQKSVDNLLNRGEEHIRQLENLYLGSEKRLLSPSAVNTWLICRMRFYYKYICGLKEPVKVPGEVDSALFGELLHGIMERIYSAYKGQTLDKDIINSFIKDNAALNMIITEIIRDKYFNGYKDEISGNDMIISSILLSYIQMILKLDISFAPLIIADLEKQISSELEIDYNGAKAKISVGGIADRIDASDGIFRIIDYKTGGINMEIGSIGTLCDENNPARNSAWFQILIYCEVFLRKNPGLIVRPSLYAVRNMSDINFSDRLVVKEHEGVKLLVDDYSVIRNAFSFYLMGTIQKIFDKNEPFIMTVHRRKCESCPYRQLCQR